jgi:hypothetical protein
VSFPARASIDASLYELSRAAIGNIGNNAVKLSTEVVKCKAWARGEATERALIFNPLVRFKLSDGK